MLLEANLHKSRKIDLPPVSRVLIESGRLHYNLEVTEKKPGSCSPLEFSY